MSYLVYKLIHVVAVVLWLGPSLGAYWFLLKAHREKSSVPLVWVEKNYEQVLIVEHVAFLFLLASGVAMVEKMGWHVIDQPWFSKKLMLVGLVVLIEIVDIWISHYLYRKARRLGDNIKNPVWQKFLRRRKIFYRWIIPMLALIIPAIFYFAVVKPF
ncbi:MAG: DUF2269 family protein [Deltaproteobacteria bacterium]|nr:DUF2269 family protein [Deltaproteobacteria bacterium]